MIKRVIFDLDGTLISGIDFNIYAREALENIGYDSSEYTLKQISDAVNAYENKATEVDMNLMSQYFNEYLDDNIGMKFLEEYLIVLCDAIPSKLDKEVKKTLEYLSNKYKLSILTNWFRASQEPRIEKLGLDKYFDCMIYGDMFKKPDVVAYQHACYDTDECNTLMVGDSYKSDFCGAINAGIDSILLDKDDLYRGLVPDKKRIRTISELRNVL